MKFVKLTTVNHSPVFISPNVIKAWAEDSTGTRVFVSELKIGDFLVLESAEQIWAILKSVSGPSETVL